MQNISQVMCDRIYTLINNTFDEYEVEVFLTDIWCLYQTYKYGVQYDKIVITKPSGDRGIDSIIIPKFSKCYTNRKYYFLQISTGSKNPDNVFKELNQAIEFYQDILERDFIIDNIETIVVTLKNSQENDIIKSISGRKLLDMIYEVGTKYNIINKMELDTKYVENVKIRADIYRILWKYIDKNDEMFSVYIKFLINNYYLIQQSFFELLVEHNMICNNKIDDFINSISYMIPNKNVVKIISKIWILNEKIFDKYQNDILELLLVLEDIVTKFDRIIEIVPTDWYIALKAKSDSTVIAYFSYEYANTIANGYNFAFRCRYDSLTNKLKSNNRIISKEMIKNKEDETYKEYKDNKNFNLDTNLRKPCIELDKNIIEELVNIALLENGYI